MSLRMRLRGTGKCISDLHRCSCNIRDRLSIHLICLILENEVLRALAILLMRTDHPINIYSGVLIPLQGLAVDMNKISLFQCLIPLPAAAAFYETVALKIRPASSFCTRRNRNEQILGRAGGSGKHQTSKLSVAVVTRLTRP